MFGRRFKPDFDLTSPYPEIATHRAAVKARDWAAARAVYDRADWDLRQMLAWDTGELAEVEAFLRGVLAKDPRDQVAATMLGFTLVNLGWTARSARRAQYVSDKQFETFFAYLRQAEEVLGEVCATDPVNPPAWTMRLAIARGLELGDAEARRRYDELSRHVPHFLPAQRQILQQLAPKWGGSLEAMYGFARECMQAAPPGAHNAVLVVEAHAEHHNDAPPGVDHYQDAQAWNEIHEAGQRSVLHPDFRHTPGWVQTLSTFGLGYAFVGDMVIAKQLFTRLRPYGDDSPWWVERKTYTTLYRTLLAMRTPSVGPVR